MTAQDTCYKSVLDELETVCSNFKHLVSQMNLAGIQENIATVSNQSKDQMQMLEKLKLKIESLIEERKLSCEKNRNLHLQNAYLRYQFIQIMKACSNGEDEILNTLSNDEDEIMNTLSKEEEVLLLALA